MSHDIFSDRWDDYQLLGIARTNGPTIPTFALRANNVYMWRFDNTTHEFHASVQMSHGWNGGILKPHVHWEPSANGTYTGTWSMDYIFSNPAQGSSVTVVGNTTGSFNVAASLGTMYFTDLNDISISGMPSTLMQFRLKLSSFTAGANIWVWGWDFHYQKNRAGTINPATNP